MSHDAHLPGYTIRRPLGARALLSAVGVGIAAGVAAFYLARVMLERTPLLTDEERRERARALERRSGRRISALGGEMVGGTDDLEDDVLVPADDFEDDDDEQLDDLGIAERIRAEQGRPMARRPRGGW